MIFRRLRVQVPFCYKVHRHFRHIARIALMVEQRLCNAMVRGSSPRVGFDNMKFYMRPENTHVPIISEQEFRTHLILILNNIRYMGFKSVSGPGRSGAVAGVYASHYLHIPFITKAVDISAELQPHLVIDTAISSRKTLKKAHRKANAAYSIAIFQEPPRVKFWYEIF